ncbi:rhomboid family intramembrane serine protease [Pontibaca methylaminivorans]|uniref:rhomboid family intramembrane serine protease n=1 Tax=Pontibaca methylaminivorans TaxID=515897 RepID=UPI002FD8DAFE
MFPIRDHNPSGRTPYVVYALIASNVLVFLANLGGFESYSAMSRFYYNWTLIPARIETGSGYHTLLTSMFLHDGLLHIGGNMLFLWIFGDNLEDRMGHALFLAFYMASGIGAGLIHVLTAPGSLVPTLGASGAIAGVLGGYLLLYPRARVDVLIILIVFIRIFPLPAWVMLAFWLALQAISGLGSNPDAGGVAYWAHTGGFAVGFLLTVPLWLRLGGPAFWRIPLGARARAGPDAPRSNPTRIPRVPRR